MPKALARISLLHATRCRPEQAVRVRREWLEAAAHPERVEHLFAVDHDDSESLAAFAGLNHHVVEEIGGGCVAAWNLAARECQGDILVQLSDDWEPVPGWDDEFERRLRDPDRSGVLRISDGHRTDDLLCMAIFTRAWLEEIGDFLHPGYFSMFSDDEFSFRAYDAGVVIDARDLVLRHVHPSFEEDVEEDETYRRQNDSRHFFEGESLFLKRFPEAMGRWLHPGTARRQFLAKSHVGKLKGVSATGVSGEGDEKAAEWREFGKRADAVLVRKTRHAKVFLASAKLGLSLVDGSRHRWIGRLAWRPEHGRRLGELQSELERSESLLEEKRTREAVERLVASVAGAESLLEEIRKHPLGKPSVNRSTLAHLKQLREALEKWWTEALSLSRERPDVVGRDPWPRPDIEGIPVYVMSFNQLTYLRNMVEQLRELEVDPGEIHVVDNCSTWAPVKDYLDEIESQGVQVHRLSKNFGPRALFDPEAGLSLPPVFALTDADLQFSAEMPVTFREDLLQIALWCRVWKAGSALSLEEESEFREGDYAQGKSIREWEEMFWKNSITHWKEEVGDQLGPLREQVYRAGIDTTFAVYLRDRKGPDLLEAVRVAGPFEARHLPWYSDTDRVRKFPDEDEPSVNPIRLTDGRTMVRPGPGEIEEYVREGFGSTISRMAAPSEPDSLLVRHPADGYSFAVVSGSPHASWWRDEFSAGCIDPTLELLRQLGRSPRGPSHLVDLGAGFGEITLWAALRFSRVHAIEPGAEARRELAGNIATNRFEHLVDLSDGLPGDSLSAFLDSIQATSAGINLVVHARLGDDRKESLDEILETARSHPDRVGGVVVSIDPRRSDASQIHRFAAGEGCPSGWRLLRSTGARFREDTAPLPELETIDALGFAWINPDALGKSEDR